MTFDYHHHHHDDHTAMPSSREWPWGRFASSIAPLTKERPFSLLVAGEQSRSSGPLHPPPVGIGPSLLYTSTRVPWSSFHRYLIILTGSGIHFPTRPRTGASQFLSVPPLPGTQEILSKQLLNKCKRNIDQNLYKKARTSFQRTSTPRRERKPNPKTLWSWGEG